MSPHAVFLILTGANVTKTAIKMRGWQVVGTGVEEGVNSFILLVSHLIFINGVSGPPVLVGRIGRAAFECNALLFLASKYS